MKRYIFILACLMFACDDESASAPERSVLEILTVDQQGAEQRVADLTVKRGARVQFAIRSAQAERLSFLPYGENINYPNLYTAAKNRADTTAINGIRIAGQQLDAALFRQVPGQNYREAVFTQTFNVPGEFYPVVVTTNFSYPSTEDLKRSYSNTVKITVTE